MKQSLTERQIEVFRMVCEGKTSREIGEILGLSFRTVEVHRRNIRQQLGLTTTIDMLRYAMKQKWIKL